MFKKDVITPFNVFFYSTQFDTNRLSNRMVNTKNTYEKQVKHMIRNIRMTEIYGYC